MEGIILHITGINPEPWTVGTLSLGYNKGKAFPKMSKDGRLRDYQTGIAESIKTAYPELKMFDPLVPLELHCKFWRGLDRYTTETGRSHTRHVADATNMTKSLEDALQGILFKNDNQVKWSSGQIIDEGLDVEPRIMIICHPLAVASADAWQTIANYDDARFASGEEPRPFPGNVYMVATK